MLECPCYELTDGCGCQCCAPSVIQPNNSTCIILDERFCECWSVDRIMLHSGIDPVAARNSGGSYSRDTLIKSMELK